MCRESSDCAMKLKSRRFASIMIRATRHDSLGVVILLFAFGCARDGVPQPTIERTTFYVPQDSPTIQSAIDLCTPGDTVLVAAGTYAGIGNCNLLFHGLSIYLIAPEGPETTVIDCSDRHEFNRALEVRRGESVVVRGFTMRDGDRTNGDYGGSISCSGGTISVIDCIICDNRADFGGGGVFLVNGAHGLFESCRLVDNVSDNGGGGAFQVAFSSELVLKGCYVSGNASPGGGGISSRQSSRVVVTECEISGNFTLNGGGGGLSIGGGTFLIDSTVIQGNVASNWFGGGVLCAGTQGKMQNCTVAGNAASFSGGGVDVTASDVIIDKTIIWGNCSGEYAAINVVGPRSNVTISCSAFNRMGIGGTGNWAFIGEQVEEDPLFCHPLACGLQTSGDYRIQEDSPCREKRSPCGSRIGASEVCFGRRSSTAVGRL